MIGRRTSEVEAFWRQCHEATGIAAHGYHVSSFADPALSANVDKIGELARGGPKRATAHLERVKIDRNQFDGAEQSLGQAPKRTRGTVPRHLRPGSFVPRRR